MGPDHPQKEIYYESKHGIAYLAHKDNLKMDQPKWVVGEDYHLAPTCATCHMSATKHQPVTHDVGMRISWNNRPVLSVRPEVSDANLGLPGKDVPWQKLRDNMKNVCLNCHDSQWVDNFYMQYDALIELYHEKFAKPGKALMALAKPLLRPAKFSNKLDFVWFELWHHEGRRARHGASMMAPDYTHWHGTYELARNWTTEFIPEIEGIIREFAGRAEAEKDLAVLKKTLKEVQTSDAWNWSINQEDPQVKAARQKRQEEFKKRYK